MSYYIVRYSSTLVHIILYAFKTYPVSKSYYSSSLSFVEALAGICAVITILFHSKRPVTGRSRSSPDAKSDDVYRLLVRAC